MHRRNLIFYETTEYSPTDRKNILFSRKYPARIFCKTYNEGGKSGEQGLGEGGRRDGVTGVRTNGWVSGCSGEYKHAIATCNIERQFSDHDICSTLTKS